MALTPLFARSMPQTQTQALRPAARPTPLPPPMRAPETAAQTPAQSDDPLTEQLKSAQESSLPLQLLRALLLREGLISEESTEAERSPAPAPASPPPVPQSTSLEIDVQTRVTQSVSVAIGLGEAGQGELSVSVTQSSSTRLTVSREGAGAASGKKDPLLLDLDGDGIETSGVAEGAVFDIDGDGQNERVSVARGGDALLALDRNGNGQIDDGRELFGDHHGAAHGFAELARFDDNADGQIDAQDAVFDALQLLSFAADGAQQRQSLKQAGVRAIYLDYEQAGATLQSGDEIAQTGRFAHQDGREGVAADLLLRFDGRA